MRRLRPAPSDHGSGQAAYAPMVDMLTILLVFLLKSYSVDPPVRPDDADFTLPTSATEQPVGPARDIDVTEHGIYVDGWRAASTRYYLEHDDTMILELYEDLQASGSQVVNVRADTRVPYRLLQKVLFSAQEAGMDRITLVASSRGGL